MINAYIILLNSVNIFGKPVMIDGMKILLISILLFSFSGCSMIDFIACGDRGSSGCHGLFCLKPICYGDAYDFCSKSVKSEKDILPECRKRND